MNSLVEDFIIPKLSRKNKTQCIKICESQGQGLIHKNIRNMEWLSETLLKVVTYLVKMISKLLVT